MKKLSTVLISFLLLSGIILAQDSGIPGLDFNANASPYSIQTYDGDNVLTTLNWTALTPSIHAVSRSCVTFISIGGNDYLYQFGGGSSTQYTTAVRYDITADTWSSGYASIPSNMSAATAVTIGDKIYLFGGENSAGLGKTYMYDPVADSWTAKANMLTPVTDALVVKLNDNFVYVICGGDGLFGANVYSSVQLYDVNADSYTACTSFPISLGMLSGGILNYTIIAGNGWNGTTGNAAFYKGTINPSDLTDITWTAIGDYPAGGVTRAASFPVTYGTYPSAAGVFFTGGAINGGTLTGATHLYNYCTDQWETLSPSLALPRSNFKASGNMDNVVYAVSGYTTAGVGNNDKATLTDITGNCYSPVPVELTSFSVSLINGNVMLNWNTATETNNKGFQIERKTENTQFQNLAFVDGHGTTTQSQQYSYTDYNTISGKYIYRLKQIDFDGSYSYSKIIEIDLNKPLQFTLSQNYPNPFNPSTNINFSIAKDSKVTLNIYNVLGQKVVEVLNSNLPAGVHSIKFNASNLNSGIYFYKLEAKGIDGSTFNSTQKMVLTK